jgi:L-threonate 2-dehydrogenase
VSDMTRAALVPTLLAASTLQIFPMTAAAGMPCDDDASVARLYAKIAELDLADDSDSNTIAESL